MSNRIDSKVRTGFRMNGSVIDGVVSVPYHDGREPSVASVALTPDELRQLSSDLADLAHRVEHANLALVTPAPTP